MPEKIEKMCHDAMSSLNVPDKTPYAERLAEELRYIDLFDRQDYILSLKKFIDNGEEKKRRNNNGLVYAYLLGLTDQDPIKEDIPHNKYLGDPPDIDIDLSEEAKELVEKYLIEKHGQDRVAHIYTISYFTPKSTLRMLCRALSLTADMGIVKEITDFFGTDIGEGNELENQIKVFKSAKKNLSTKTKKFLDEKPKYTKLLPKDDRNLTNEKILFKYAKRISGQVERTGKHASGIAISSDPFHEFAPLKKMRGEILLSLQEGGHAKEVSSFGIIKFDYLGLKELSKQVAMFKLVKEYYGREIYEEIIYRSDLDDGPSLDVFNTADTIGIFQFGSEGMRQCLSNAIISKFSDVSIMNAIYRPGPLQNLDALVKNMHDPQLIEYDNDVVKPIMEKTYGIPIYQEQIMQLMGAVGGLTMSEADKARGILKKLSRNKNPDIKSIEYYEYMQMLTKFEAGAAKKKYTKEQAKRYVEELSSHMGYSFNLAHATAYSENAYLGAYIKANYPLVFYKVSCDYESDKEILGLLFRDAIMRGVKIRGFDINKTNYDFSIDVEANELVPGFNMIKGVSKKIIDAIVVEREKNGKFKNMVDFFVALDKISYTIRTIDPLINLGAFDEIYPNRKKLLTLFRNFQTYQKKKKLKTEKNRWKFADIFTMTEKEGPIKDYTTFEKLEMEFKYLELYMINNPMEYARKHYARKGVETVSIQEREDRNDKVLGVIVNYKVKKTKNNDPYLDLTFSDTIDTINVKVWSDKMSEKLQQKGSIGIFKLDYNPMFRSYNLLAFNIVEEEK